MATIICVLTGTGIESSFDQPRRTKIVIYLIKVFHFLRKIHQLAAISKQFSPLWDIQLKIIS